MLPVEVLVVELLAIDGFAACAGSLSEVTALDHKVLDDAVEDGALVVEGLSQLAVALLASAKGSEVLCGLGGNIGVEPHSNAPRGTTTNGDVEEYIGTGHFGARKDSGLFGLYLGQVALWISWEVRIVPFFCLRPVGVEVEAGVLVSVVAGKKDDGGGGGVGVWGGLRIEELV